MEIAGSRPQKQRERGRSWSAVQIDGSASTDARSHRRGPGHPRWTRLGAATQIRGAEQKPPGCLKSAENGEKEGGKRIVPNHKTTGCDEMTAIALECSLEARVPTSVVPGLVAMVPSDTRI